MFLFERDDIKQNTLYTGDFRLENIKLETLSALHDTLGKPVRIDWLYLDTTFASPDYSSFPSRDEAIESIWHLVDTWVKKNGEFQIEMRSL